MYYGNRLYVMLDSDNRISQCHYYTFKMVLLHDTICSSVFCKSKIVVNNIIFFYFSVSTTESKKFKFYAEFNLVYCRNDLFQYLLD